MSEPSLSIVLVTADDARSVRRTLRHLRAQTIAGSVELLLVAPSRATLGLRDDDVAGIGHVRIIEVGSSVLADARAAAVVAASCPIIAFAEDHCYPEPQWAEEIVTAHHAGARAVGPLMHNENPRSSLSRTAMALQFSCCTPPATSGPCDSLPWHNTSYRRDDLLAYDGDLGWWLTAEGPIQDRLRSQGHDLRLHTDAAVSHLNISRLRVFVSQAYWGGRLFASTRVVAAEWSRGMRLLRALAAPIVPFVRISRAVGSLRRGGRLREVPGLIPALFLGTCMHALGEAVGTLVGMGPTRERYSDFEHGRLRFVNRADLAMLREREPPDGAFSGSTS